MSAPWISADQLRDNDRSQNTKLRHKDALTKWTKLCRISKENRGFGLGSNYIPSTRNGHCLAPSELIDERVSHYFTYYFNLYNNCQRFEVYPTMRKLHQFISYCCRTLQLGHDMKDVAHLKDSNQTWKGIWNHPAMKEYNPEKAPSFTADDIDKLDSMSIFNSAGNIHKDLLKRKLLYKMSQSQLRRGGKLGNALFSDFEESLEAKPGRICLVYSTAYTKTHRGAENHVAVCECGTDNDYEYHHDPSNWNCVIKQWRGYKYWVRTDDAEYCSSQRMAPLTTDWLWRGVAYKKGEKKKQIRDDLKERYFKRTHWAENGDYGYKNNYNYLDKLLNLSVNRGINIEANKNKRMKTFKTHTGKRSGIKRNEIYGKNVDKSVKMLMASHHTEKQYNEYMDGMVSLKADAAFKIADEIQKIRKKKPWPPQLPKFDVPQSVQPQSVQPQSVQPQSVQSQSVQSVQPQSVQSQSVQSVQSSQSQSVQSPQHVPSQSVQSVQSVHNLHIMPQVHGVGVGVGGGVGGGDGGVYYHYPYGAGHVGTAHVGAGHVGTGHVGAGHVGAGHVGAGHVGAGHVGAGHVHRYYSYYPSIGYGNYERRGQPLGDITSYNSNYGYYASSYSPFCDDNAFTRHSPM